MSSAISCTRATAQRVAFGTVRCKRFASTEAAIVDAAATTPILAGRRPFKATTLSERMHRAVYPQCYNEDGQPKIASLKYTPRLKKGKPIEQKWAPVMKEPRVNAGLSTCTSVLTSMTGAQLN